MYSYYITGENSNLLLMTVFYFLVLNFYIVMKTCSLLNWQNFSAETWKMTGK